MHRKSNRPGNFKKTVVAITTALSVGACGSSPGSHTQAVFPKDKSLMTEPVPFKTSDSILEKFQQRKVLQEGPGYISQAAVTAGGKSILVTVFNPRMYNLEHINPNTVTSPNEVNQLNYWAVFNGDFFAIGNEAPLFQNRYGTPYGPVVSNGFDNDKGDITQWGFFAISNQGFPRCSRPNETEDLSNEKFVVGAENQPYMIDGRANGAAVESWRSANALGQTNRSIIAATNQGYVVLIASTGISRAELLDMFNGTPIVCANSLDSGSSTFGHAGSVTVAANPNKSRTLLGIAP